MSFVLVLKCHVKLFHIHIKELHWNSNTGSSKGYSHRTKVRPQWKRSNSNAKTSKNKQKISEKLFAFSFAVARCERALTSHLCGRNYHPHPNSSDFEREEDGDDPVDGDTGQHEDGHLARPHRTDPHRLTQPALPPVIRVHYVPDIQTKMIPAIITYSYYMSLFNSQIQKLPL